MLLLDSAEEKGMAKLALCCPSTRPVYPVRSDAARGKSMGVVVAA
jgi:hypothetical protein